jgi:hypothetical protein
MKTKAALFFALFHLCAFCLCGQAGIALAKATGTGRTTGHIATLSVRNASDQPGEIQIGPFYIPSGGKYQSYVIPYKKVITVPPRSTVDVPLSGYCTDIHRPPVPDGSGFPPVSSWVSVDPETPPALDWAQTPGPGISANPTGQPVITVPGTDTPLGVNLDMDQRPDLAGPLLVYAVTLVEEAYNELKSQGAIQTPYSKNNQAEKEAVIQQFTWYYTTALEGGAYTKDQFEGRLVAQLETNAGKKKEELPPAVQEQFDQGVDDFWSSFTLVGVEAKLIADPEEEEEDKPIPPAEKEEAECEHDTDLKFNPEFHFDMKISENWGDEKERKERIEEAKKAIGQHISIGNEDVFQNYDISRHPTSTTAFWKVNHVGGFASAYARTRFIKKADGSTEWVWSTESLEANAQGESTLSLSFETEEDCYSMVVGTSLSRIKASGSVVDAVAGNDPKSLPALRVTTWLGKQAILFLLERKIGKTKDGFGEYLKEAATDEVKDALKEQIEEKGKEVLDNVLEELGIELEGPDFEIPDIDPTDLEKTLENLLGIEIPSLEEGVDAAFDLIFYSNTYATAFGAMNIWVGNKSGTVLAQSRKFYQRKSLEDSKEAIHGTSDQCSEMVLTDAQPGSLSIKTQGFSTMTCKADGNGSAQARLESMHVELLVGVCFCPDKKPQVVKTSLSGWYSTDQTLQKRAFDDLERQAKAHIQQKLDDGSLKQTSSSAEFSKALEQFIKEWAKGHPFAWTACK